MNHVRKAFGEDADLYQVLGLTDRDEAENPAKLRKAYFRKALVYHPDKTKEKDETVAKEKFQAISFAYNILKNADKRAEYNETGHVDEEGDSDDENDASKANWKDYFDRIFGKVTTSKIDQFAVKYKCSEEEQKDVLAEYKKRKGNLVKMMEFVMLSEPLDARRWIEDYIDPAIESGKVPDYKDAVQKSMKQLEKKIEKEQNKADKKQTKSKKQAKPSSSEEEDSEDEEHDSEETETESEDEHLSPPAKKKRKSTGGAQAKEKAKGNDDLVAMIQANQKSRGGASVLASLGARYGVKMDDDDDDPLNDEEFAKIQSNMGKKTKKRQR